MADTQRDGRDGRTNSGSADRPDRGAAQGADPGAVAGEEPGGIAARSHNGRARSGHGSGCSCWACWMPFGSCRRAPVRPVVAGSEHLEVHLRLLRIWVVGRREGACSAVPAISGTAPLPAQVLPSSATQLAEASSLPPIELSVSRWSGRPTWGRLRRSTRR